MYTIALGANTLSMTVVNGQAPVIVQRDLVVNAYPVREPMLQVLNDGTTVTLGTKYYIHIQTATGADDLPVGTMTVNPVNWTPDEAGLTQAMTDIAAWLNT